MSPKSKATSERRSAILATIPPRIRIFALIALILENLLVVACYSLPQAKRLAAFIVSIIVLVVFLVIVFLLEWRSPGTTRSDVVAMIKQLVVKHKEHISPPTLAFRALAEYFSLPQSLGFRLVELNPHWKRDDDEWRKRAAMLERFALLNQSGTDYARSELGSLYVFFALRDPQYHEVWSLLEERKWHLQFVAA
jgi:hypothetical protein